jgi:hypothetical protein
MRPTCRLAVIKRYSTLGLPLLATNDYVVIVIAIPQTAIESLEPNGPASHYIPGKEGQPFWVLSIIFYFDTMTRPRALLLTVSIVSIA